MIVSTVGSIQVPPTHAASPRAAAVCAVSPCGAGGGACPLLVCNSTSVNASIVCVASRRSVEHPAASATSNRAPQLARLFSHTDDRSPGVAASDTMRRRVSVTCLSTGALDANASAAAVGAAAAAPAISACEYPASLSQTKHVVSLIARTKMKRNVPAP